MAHTRRWIAVLVLGALSALALRASLADPPFTGDAMANWRAVMLLAMGAGVVGLALGREWGRWLGLATGVAATQYLAMWLVADGWRTCWDFGLRWQDELAFLAGPILLSCLVGRSMDVLFAAPASRDARGARLAWWASIANVGTLATFLFATLHAIREVPLEAWPLTALLAASTVLLVPGVVLLAQGRTAGLLLVALAGLVQIGTTAAAVSFIGVRGLAMVAVFLPGLATGFAALGVYARPMWRFLR